MRVAILGDHKMDRFEDLSVQISDELEKYGAEVVIDGNHDIVLGGFDCIISLGGDGTFLRNAINLTDNVPIVGINSGRLGFLADNSEDQLVDLVKDLCEKKYRIENRTLLELVTPNETFEVNYALNEIAILKTDSSSMIAVHAYINDEYVNSYWGDGLLVVTPTGSTAYSLSVGGPIMTPNSKSLIITSVAPHSLNVRPIVISDEVELRLEVESRAPHYMLALDSRSSVMPVGESIIIRKANHTIRVIERLDNSFYNTLRNKLMWGADRRN